MIKGQRGNFRERLVAEANKQGLTMEQQEAQLDDGLKADNPEASRPLAVRDGQMLATYVAPHYRLGKNDEHIVEMEFSFPLTKEHKGMLPRGVGEAWKMSSDRYPSIDVNEVPAQTVTVRLAPDMKKKGEADEYEIHLVGADIVRAKVKRVEVTGKGKVQKVTRFSFRVAVDADDVGADVRKFADLRFGREIWIELDQTQASLLNE
jgi:hypothetical protein